ncbi:MAG TPA: Druantia anti-phage system protein DruA [Desulfomonilia bacterium]
MLDLKLKHNSQLHRLISEHKPDVPIFTESSEDRVKLLIVRDLLRLGWEMKTNTNRISFTPPSFYNKQIVKDSMQIKRQESIQKNKKWITENILLARHNLADGHLVWESKIEPMIEVCEEQKQFDLFRIFRYYWSSPYSDYVGRRIKLLIRDNALPNKPLIGIAALGSSIVHIPDRDNWIGWNKETRTKNLVYTMDAYVLGALPPYNHLLGGKLISYIIASNEVRNIYKRKYKDTITNISKRKANDLACLFTTSLYGKSSQYNRIKIDNNLLYIPIGQTKGFGTLHLTDETFEAMRELLRNNNIDVTNKFGDGPIWRMRVIRTAADILGFNSDLLLNHSFKRQIYAIPLADNFKEFLNGNQKKPHYLNYTLDELVNHWKERWLINRKKNIDVKNNIHNFCAKDFNIN